MQEIEEWRDGGRSSIVVAALEHVLAHPEDTAFIEHQIPHQPHRTTGRMWIIIVSVTTVGLLVGVVRLPRG